MGKDRNTLAKFFSRKGLSIKKSEDVKKYLDYLRSGKQWRVSSYSAPHLKPYYFDSLDSKISESIISKFSKAAFWDRHPATLTKREFIQRVVHYGIFEDVLQLIKLFKKSEIKALYSDVFAMIREFNKPLIPHA